MSKNPDFTINNKWIVSHRGEKNPVDPLKPYSWTVEKERTASGFIEGTGTIFLTNRECPFLCLMCDLWKNTTDFTIPVGAIPAQIEYALKEMPPVKHLKLYNCGSFFDKNAIPEEDYNSIASLVSHFETVIVESHPKFINAACLRFRDMLKPELNVAVGLETIHREVLKKLNKQMTPEEFMISANYLKKYGIRSRAFILLRPPFMSETEGIYWAKRSMDFAFSSGVECCTIIPVRAGNGAMEVLQEKGFFTPPDIRSLEAVLEYGLTLKSGRVFADTWDLNLLGGCDKCLEQRKQRIEKINLGQKFIRKIECTCDPL